MTGRYIPVKLIQQRNIDPKWVDVFPIDSMGIFQPAMWSLVHVGTMASWQVMNLIKVMNHIKDMYDQEDTLILRQERWDGQVMRWRFEMPIWPWKMLPGSSRSFPISVSVTNFRGELLNFLGNNYCQVFFFAIKRWTNWMFGIAILQWRWWFYTNSSPLKIGILSKGKEPRFPNHWFLGVIS